VAAAPLVPCSCGLGLVASEAVSQATCCGVLPVTNQPSLLSPGRSMCTLAPIGMSRNWNLPRPRVQVLAHSPGQRRISLLSSRLAPAGTTHSVLG
jgi:hypothetical protein